MEGRWPGPRWDKPIGIFSVHRHPPWRHIWDKVFIWQIGKRKLVSSNQCINQLRKLDIYKEDYSEKESLLLWQKQRRKRKQKLQRQRNQPFTPARPVGKSQKLALIFVHPKRLNRRMFADTAVHLLVTPGMYVHQWLQRWNTHVRTVEGSHHLEVQFVNPSQFGQVLHH